LITREVFAEIPPRVVYTLTSMGESLIEPISAISTWAEQHMPAITAAQERYDAGA
jgi:DNA-binding HxlR family transcriptional regulator